MHDPLAAAPSSPLVTVVVANFNGWHHLRPCLTALAQTRGVPFETIVVDNGSRDGSVAHLRAEFSDVQVIALERNVGFGAANHIGARAGKGEYLALLNNDTEVSPDWLIHLLQPLANEVSIAATSSRLVFLREPDVVNSNGGAMSRLGLGYDRDYRLPVADLPPCEEPVDVIFPVAAAMLMRRSEFEAVGFDPEIFMYHEDVDLGWRLWLTDRRVVVCARSLVKHLGSATTRRTHGDHWRESMGLRHCVRTLLKCYERANAWSSVLGILRWLRIRGEYLAIARIVGWNLLHLPSTLVARQKIQAGRQISDAELFARGLIDAADFPQHPELHATHSEPVLPSPLLRAGEPSGESRLRAGWHEPETVGAVSARWTNGEGRCFLQVAPQARGMLRVRFQPLPGELPDRSVHVTCNAQTASLWLDPAVRELAMPVQADAAGILDITIRSVAWRPDAVIGSTDSRQLGCMVSEIALGPEAVLPQRASVLMPTFNRRDILLQNLEALTSQTWPELEVILVNDGSTDGTAEAVAEWQHANAGRLNLQVFHQPNSGPARAHNHAVSRATGDVLIFIGDDTRPQPNFVELHMRKHAELGLGCAVLGRTIWDAGNVRVTPFLRFIGEMGPQFGYAYLRDGHECPFTTFYGSNISIARDVLGPEPFDAEAFPRAGWEDIELGYRLHRRGLRIVYHAAAVLQHNHRYRLRHFLRRQESVGKSSHVIFRLHPELLHHPLIAPNESGPRPPWRWLAADRFDRLWEWLDEGGVELSPQLYRALVERAFLKGRHATGESGA
jgi:GT2 family glycosyltransferase